MDRDVFLSANNSLFGPNGPDEACMDLADLLAEHMDATPSPLPSIDEPLPSPLAGLSSPLPQAQDAAHPQFATMGSHSNHSNLQPEAGTSGHDPHSLPCHSAFQPTNPPAPPQPPAPAQQQQQPQLHQQQQQQQRPKKKKIRDEAARSRRKAARKRQSMQDMEESLVQKMEEMKFLEQENEKLRRHQSILDSVISTRSHQLGLVPQIDALPASSTVTTSGRDLTPLATTKKHSAQEAGSSQGESRIPRYPADTTLHSHSLNLFAAKPGTHIDPTYCQEITPKLFLEVYKDHIFKLSEHLRILESQLPQQGSSSSASSSAPATTSTSSSAQSGSHTPPDTLLVHTPVSTFGPATERGAMQTQMHAPTPTSLNSAVEKGVINEACCVAHLFKFSSVHRPELVANQMARHLESGEEQVPDASHWRLLLQQLQFSGEQVSALLGASQLHYKLLRNVLSERSRLQTSLREYEEGSTSANSFNLAYRLYVPTTAELLEKLLRNLRQERSLGWMLQGFLISHVCTVLQTAKVFAYSYPYMPDARPIISTLWSDMESSGTLPAEFARFKA